MNDINRRFTAWLSGYYEDFQTMRVIAEGEDYSENSFFTNRRDSHAGNTMAVQAYNNTRFTFDYLTRSFTSLMPLPLIGNGQAGAAASLHNEGPSQWLTHDPNRLGSTFYEGRANLTYPDTIGDAASLRTFGFPKRADYSHYASGWGTHNTYWVRHGDSDATYERSGFENNANPGYPFGTTATRGYAKFDITSTQPADTSGIPRPTIGDNDNSNYRKHKVMMNSSLCGVYLGETGEVAVSSGGIGLPFSYLYPIKSPSGKPFFRHTISRRYGDWLGCIYNDDGTGKGLYRFDDGINFPNQGSLGADDQWFPRNISSTFITTSVGYSAGATSITIPSSDTTVEQRTQILDPTIDQHLPDKTSGTPTQQIQVGSEAKEYSAVSVNGSGDITFTLTSALAGSHSAPVSVAYYRWIEQAAGDTTITFYNITTAGTPSPSPVFQYRQEGSGGNPLLCFKTNAGAVTTTDARTRNGESGVQNSPTFSVTTNTSKGYTYYQMIVNLVAGHSGFDADPQKFVARDPFFTLDNVWGKLRVGDYLTRRGHEIPEKILTIRTDGSFTTDGDFNISDNGSTHARLATYGSGTGSTDGRAGDGMFGFQPIIVGDTELNAVSDGERFTIRLAHQSFDRTASAVPGQVDATFMLSVGYNSTEPGFDLNERGNNLSKAAITHLFRPVTGLGMNAVRATQFNMFEEGTTGKNTYTMDQLWYDFDIVTDFTNQRYFVFCDGSYVSTGSFNPKTDGTPWTASDFYGWSLGIHFQDGYDASDTTGWQTMTTMIDRAGYIYALQDRMTHASIPATIQQEDIVVEKFKTKSMVDGISSMEISIADDSDLLNLPQLASGRPNWKILLFRDNDYRPVFSHIVTAVNFKQSRKKNSKDLLIKGKDSLGELDFQFPYFDIGNENGMPSFVAAYRRYEVTNYADIFHFGTTSLLNLNAFLGLDEDSKGSTGEYLPRYDQRMRLYSGHPIQIYSNENSNGPNHVEDAWEVSRLISHFMPDSNDPTQTRVVLKSDFIEYSGDQIPAGVQVAIKGMWRNKGTSNSTKTPPTIDEQGFLACTNGASRQTLNPHNDYRGLHTVKQAQTTTTSNHLSGLTVLNVADTSLFPASGTVKVGGTGLTGFGGVTKTYSSKTSTELNLTSTLGSDFGAGTVVRETTSTNYFVIDTQWRNSLVVTEISNDGGFLKFKIEPARGVIHDEYELMPGTASENSRSVLAKNDAMTPTIAPNDQLFNIYIQPNAAGIAHESALADLPKELYTTSEVTTNSGALGYAEVKTTKQVSSLSSNLQTALGSPISLVGSQGGLADGLEGDLGYVTFPKQSGGSFRLRNVGSSYNYRNLHSRWVRDLPQSLWFQKTFGNIRSYPYGATAWRGPGYTGAAISNLAQSFNSGNDTSIVLDSVSLFPFSGVCEIWTNDPNPFSSQSDNAIMLTSFTYSSKNNATNTLQGVKFADPNKGVIATTGGSGPRKVLARNIDGDYKHCFVLFADMRNDGSADADGGTRRNDFGLLHPIESNYKVEVVWADTGKKFVDLKIGADCDVWQLDAENDPATGTAWSDNISAFILDYANPPLFSGHRSDNTEVSPMYHNWESKAGAFVVIDLSKFFNLNTESNLGRMGQDAGGNKKLGEYLVEQQGEPTLIDNYYYQASASFQNAEAPIIQHFNSYRWVDAKTVLTQDVIAATPTTLTTQPVSPGDTVIHVQDNSAFPTSGSNLLINGDTFNYARKGGAITDVNRGNAGNNFTANGTFTTTGGGGSGATGTYVVEKELDATAMQALVVPGHSNNFSSATRTITWYATTGKAEGTIEADTVQNQGALIPSTLAITVNDYYVTVPNIKLQLNSQNFTGQVVGALNAGGGRLPFLNQGAFTVTDGGIGYDSAPTFVFSTGTGATARAILDNTQLNDVTGIGSAHPAGSPITFQSTVVDLDVEDTTDFPSKLGVASFAGQSTAGLIEAKSVDSNGNEFDMKYVFTYTSKTSTSLQGISYRPVKQGETPDVAAAGLWANDTFTVQGVPSMKAEGTVIRASLGSAFPMGFMVKLSGRVKTPGIGNYYEHDKIRVLQESALFNDWFKQLNIPALSDINNVPVMRDFNVDGNVAGAGSVESFGSVTQAQNKSLFQTLRTMAQAAGVGTNGSLLTMNFQMGRDNRMEFRPTYNSGLSLTRDNLKISNLKTSKATSFSHVRVLYNGGDSFVTFPALTYNSNVRFKFISAISVASYEQALEIAKQEYQKKKDPAFKVEAEVIRQSNETQRTGPMLENARFGYIADPAVQLMGRNGGYWTAGRGGLHFTGQNNALHGNIHGYGRLSLLNYKSNAVIGVGIGGYSGAANNSITYGPGNAKYPTDDLYNMFPWTQMYYWYGAKSVSYAVQIVHIPKAMPKVSETTGEELRVFISDAVATIPNTDRPDNLTAGKKFNIHFADYDFDESQSLNHCPKLQATQHGISTITTLGSGYFEVPIPESYWQAGFDANYKMVVSVNAEYLAAVARHKTADKFGGNALTAQTNVIPAGGQTLPTFSNANEFSIFPLGIREYPELGSSAVERSPYYAPRIHITDDLNFLPGTYAHYTDSHIDIDETLFVSSVEYEYTNKRLDRTKLTLEREIGRIPEGLEGYLATNPLEDTGANGGGVGGGGGGTPIPPTSPGGTGGRGGDDVPLNPVTPESFPFGYTGGQTGVNFSESFPPIMGGTDSDLGLTQPPTFSGMDYIRLNNDTGIQQMGQEGAMITPSFNANSLDETTVGKFTGTMSIDNLLPDGTQGIPGQPRPANIPQKVRAMEGIDTKFVSAEGEAAETSDGWVLPGASTVGLSEAATNVQHSLTLSATIPMDSAQPVLGLSAYVSAEVLDGDKAFELHTTITCEDTGESISKLLKVTLSQATPISHQQVDLVPQQFFESAGVEGRRLKATIVRKPGQGSDDMMFSSVVIHGVQFENVVHNNQGRPTTENLAAFSGNQVENTEPTNDPIGDTNPNPL